ncbi:substrate-binding domain-containing protein [Magnetovibrio sp.]|uniref:substrate-binding domain-containing protein n=1 Tax=Magnetovibrio sp. TaxID=2024836 RepID=UPI002F92C157
MTIKLKDFVLIALVLLFAFGVPMNWALAQDKTFIVGFPQDNMANDWRRAQVMAVEAELRMHPGYTFVHSDAQGDTAKNIQDIEDMIDRGIDLLIVSPRDTAAMTPVIANVRAQGIPVVLLTRRILTNDYTTFVSPNDDKIARRAATYMAEQLNGAGKILVLQGVPTASTAIKRTEGFLDEIAKYQNIKVVAVRPANYLRSEAIKVVETVLDEGLSFDAIYAQSDSMATGARLALKAANIDPKSKLIVGIDYIPEAREAIRAGEQNATFTYPTSGKEGAQLAVQILQGQAVEREIEVHSEMVTIFNVETIEPVF